MTISRGLAATLLASAASIALTAPAFAESPSEARIRQLEEQIQALADQVQDLKRQSATQYSDLQEARAADVKVTIDNARPTIASANGKFTASIRSTVQYDTATYRQDKSDTAPLTPALGRDLSSGTNFRRAQFGVDGIAFGEWAYSFIYDFGGPGVENQGRVSSAYVQFNGWKPFQFRIGAFAPYIGLEDSTSSADTLFLERPSPSEISRAISGGDGRSAAQIAAVGDTWLAAISWSGSSATTAAVFDEQQALNGRLAWLAYSDLDTKFVLSAGGTYVYDTPDSVASVVGATSVTFSDRPELRVDGTQLITASVDADSVLIGGIEAGFVWKSFYAQGGYFNYSANRRASPFADPDFSGWYLQASWILTGESKPYDAGRAAFRNPRPAHPVLFGDDPGAGAWELAARYSSTDLNYDEHLAPASGGIRGGEQEIWTVGVNWYPNNIVTFRLAFTDVSIDRLNPSAIAASPPYPAVAAGAAIGQDFQTISLRTQIAL
jgi:phosphate-selective porin OprO/OprP